MTQSPGPLSGLRIVEVSSFVAAPLCGLTLSQLGAEVIRIDPIGGGLRLQSLARHRQGREHLLDRTQQRQTVTVSGHARRTRPRTDSPTGHGAGTWRRNPGHQRRRP